MIRRPLDLFDILDEVVNNRIEIELHDTRLVQS